MNKRLEKRHKRQVKRAKEQARVSEPDLRTPEQLLAAKELSRPVGRRAAPDSNFAIAPSRNHGRPVTSGTSRGDT